LQAGFTSFSAEPPVQLFSVTRSLLPRPSATKQAALGPGRGRPHVP
jgi:hypothetical protein